MAFVRQHLGLATTALLIAAFMFIAAQRLGTVPVPDSGDEAFTLQVPYEMLQSGRLSLPMYRYLGGNIENVWHSFTPVYFVMLTAFLKMFGFGLTEGRAFNLAWAGLILLLVYFVGRRSFDWRAGLVAVAMLVSDVSFLERSRMLRNDFAAAAFGLLAFYLYEAAETRKRGDLYIASGLAAGAGVMCHTNLLYILCAIAVLMLLRDGLRLIRTAKLYQFGLSAFAVMSYEVVYDIIDFKNFLLQNRGDKAHFEALSLDGLWHNLTKEPLRYQKWYAGGETFPISNVAADALHIFQLLIFIAFIYLIIVLVRAIKRGNAMSDSRVRILIVTAVVILFFALVAGPRRKNTLYMVHLSCWFALCVGVLIRDCLEYVSRLRRQKPRVRLAQHAAIAVATVAIVVYAYLLGKQTRSYLNEVRNPDLASFAEFGAALRSIVPEGLCPASITRPVIWLVFPEADDCYVTIESRMESPIDLIGKNYALIVPGDKFLRRIQGLDGDFHLLGEMDDTPYGDIKVYYLGVEPRYLTLSPKRYRFFGNQRGHVSDSQPDPH